jgi:hypothetical protein
MGVLEPSRLTAEASPTPRHQLEQQNVASVPEPSILMLLSVGAIAIMRFRRWKQ